MKLYILELVLYTGPLEIQSNQQIQDKQVQLQFGQLNYKLEKIPEQLGLVEKDSMNRRYGRRYAEGSLQVRDPELVQLNEIDEAKEAVQGHPGREQLNESFRFSDPEQLNDEFGFQGAAQTDTELEQFIDQFPEIEELKIAYRKYINTEDCISEVHKY